MTKTQEPILLRTLIEADRAWATALTSAYFGSTRVVSRGILHETQRLPGLVAADDAGPVGLVLYQIVRDACEVIVLAAATPRRGVGTALLGALRELAQQAGCRRLWLVTTNDNQGAQRFYQAQGMQQVAIHRGAITQARLLKPEIPLFGEGGNPIEDEVEYELALRHT